MDKTKKLTEDIKDILYKYSKETGIIVNAVKLDIIATIDKSLVNYVVVLEIE